MEVIDKKTLWEGSFIRAVLLTYRDHKGTLRTWEAVERVSCNGIVVIVPVTKEKEFLLIRQFRPVLNSYVIEFPAGLSGNTEAHIAAARRELIEETGYVSDDLSPLAKGPVSSGISTEMMIVFLAKNATPAPPHLKAQFPPDESENIEVIRAPLEGVLEMLERQQRNGDYFDLKIYGLIELAKRRLQADT